MLKKYLNKEVIIEEKLFEYPSTLSNKVMTPDVTKNKTEGTFTNYIGEFIELDNNTLINMKYIYRITLK